MVVLSYVFGLGIVVVIVLVVRHTAAQIKSDRAEGITRFGTSTLQGQTLTLRGATYEVNSATHAEVAGSVLKGRRSTVTRTLAGGVVAGPVGALAGHAAKKKTESSDAILTIDGEDWADSIPVGPKSYAEALRFAQAINLAARTAPQAQSKKRKKR